MREEEQGSNKSQRIYHDISNIDLSWSTNVTECGFIPTSHINTELVILKFCIFSFLTFSLKPVFPLEETVDFPMFSPFNPIPICVNDGSALKNKPFAQTVLNDLCAHKS